MALLLRLAHLFSVVVVGGLLATPEARVLALVTPLDPVRGAAGFLVAYRGVRVQQPPLTL
jgi:hypothetical protein